MQDQQHAQLLKPFALSLLKGAYLRDKNGAGRLYPRLVETRSFETGGAGYFYPELALPFAPRRALTGKFCFQAQRRVRNAPAPRS